MVSFETESLSNCFFEILYSSQWACFYIFGIVLKLDQIENLFQRQFKNSFLHFYKNGVRERGLLYLKSASWHDCSKFEKYIIWIRGQSSLSKIKES
jgi:hypothetical protein